MREFSRIERLPPYVLGIVNDLKYDARRRGEDIIDFGLGNPDMPTPKHIVDKLMEASVKEANHRYSVSKGIYKLRLAITDWYKRNHDVDLEFYYDHSFGVLPQNLLGGDLSNAFLFDTTIQIKNIGFQKKWLFTKNTKYTYKLYIETLE